MPTQSSLLVRWLGSFLESKCVNTRKRHTTSRNDSNGLNRGAELVFIEHFRTNNLMGLQILSCLYIMLEIKWKTLEKMKMTLEVGSSFEYAGGHWPPCRIHRLSFLHILLKTHRQYATMRWFHSVIFQNSQLNSQVWGASMLIISRMPSSPSTIFRIARPALFTSVVWKYSDLLVECWENDDVGVM